MTRPQGHTIKDLIDRLARLNAAEEWAGPINPSQFAALSYLARANRFSRAPSHVAEYLATTRGTASQTLKALARKGLVEEERSDQDRRSIRYAITDDGTALLASRSPLQDAIEALDPIAATQLESGLKAVVMAALRLRDGRSFGMCRSCRHFQTTDRGGFCGLLNEPLSAEDAAALCHEHAVA